MRTLSGRYLRGLLPTIHFGCGGTWAKFFHTVLADHVECGECKIVRHERPWRVRAEQPSSVIRPVTQNSRQLDFELKLSSSARDTANPRIAGSIDIPRSSTGSEPERIYSYTDSFGEELFQVVRYAGKQFIQRRRGEDGEWTTYKATDLPKVLYHMPDIVTAKRIMVCEDEQDADNLKAALGQQTQTATTSSPRGAEKWRDEFAVFFAGKQVVVFEDNDDAGRADAEKVCVSAYRYTKQVKRVALPGLLEHGDVSDFLQDHTVAEVIKYASAAPWWRPEEAEAEVSEFR